MPRQETTRLAPSPTGALHLGNARTFLINWTMARQRGWRVVLRIEDLDTPRVKPGAAAQALEDLRWLGLDWDEGPSTQRADLSPYRTALQILAAQGLLYRCACTRREVELAASAPHAGDIEPRYPGTCRGQRYTGGPLGATAVRMCAPPHPVTFHDTLAGLQTFDVQATCGDFVVWTKAEVPAYQLAVVVDDARQGITHVVRGDDLLPSTARQLWIYQHLPGSTPPRYTHLPLVVGPDGRRLAKRHGDSRIAWYRDQGVPASRILALLARWSGLAHDQPAVTPEAFVRKFALERLPRQPIVFTPEDHQWLLSS